MDKPHVVILGAGPAGVGAAYQLRRRDRAEVTVLEQRDSVGGNAGSFEVEGQRVDYGSHRLHQACDPNILKDIRSLLGDDLVKRPRHGRILLRGKWIHFPLQPLDILLHADRRFLAGVLRDALMRRSGGAHSNDETFASVLRASLGPTICESFYFPYARKIWGRDPEVLSAEQAKRRVSASTFSKLLRKVLSHLPGVKGADTGTFYYPKKGYGQISEVYAEAARQLGARVLLGSRVTRLVRPETPDEPWTIVAQRDDGERSLRADYVWSSVPVSILARMVEPPTASQVIEAADSLESRAMLLVYLQLPRDRFTEYDAHYFPSDSVSITRLSEPKNYADASEPAGRTTLCAELPCAPDDPYWSMSDDDLAGRVAADLDHAGIPLPCPPVEVRVRRLRHAYPIYAQGYEAHFDILDHWVESLPRLLSYGRQGLFAHDNTHHALYMAYAAADCLIDGEFDEQRWNSYRRVFETHVVED